jgi:hypothetical protein
MTFSSADDADTDGSERKTQNNEAIAFLVQRMNQPGKGQSKARDLGVAPTRSDFPSETRKLQACAMEIRG